MAVQQKMKKGWFCCDTVLIVLACVCIAAAVVCVFTVLPRCLNKSPSKGYYDRHDRPQHGWLPAPPQWYYDYNYDDHQEPWIEEPYHDEPGMEEPWHDEPYHEEPEPWHEEPYMDEPHPEPGMHGDSGDMDWSDDHDDSGSWSGSHDSDSWSRSGSEEYEYWGDYYWNWEDEVMTAECHVVTVQYNDYMECEEGPVGEWCQPGRWDEEGEGYYEEMEEGEDGWKRKKRQAAAGHGGAASGGVPPPHWDHMDDPAEGEHGEGDSWGDDEEWSSRGMDGREAHGSHGMHGPHDSGSMDEGAWGPDEGSRGHDDGSRGHDEGSRGHDDGSRGHDEGSRGHDEGSWGEDGWENGSHGEAPHPEGRSFRCGTVGVEYEGHDGEKHRGMLHENIDQEDNFPQCSFNSCYDDYDMNEEYLNEMYDPYTDMHTTQETTFVCYYYSGRPQVVYKEKPEPFEWYTSAGFHSVFWPALVGFILVFVVIIRKLVYIAKHRDNGEKMNQVAAPPPAYAAYVEKGALEKGALDEKPGLQGPIIEAFVSPAPEVVMDTKALEAMTQTAPDEYSA